MFLGIRTVIYPAPDLAASKAWWTGLLGIEPYFDEPFYVGFEVAGYELGLNPDADPGAGAVSYWGVGDLDAAMATLLAAGAREKSAIQDTGGGIRVAEVVEPGGGVLGLIENPHFSLPRAVSQPGPGR